MPAAGIRILSSSAAVSLTSERSERVRDTFSTMKDDENV